MSKKLTAVAALIAAAATAGIATMPSMAHHGSGYAQTITGQLNLPTATVPVQQEICTEEDGQPKCTNIDQTITQAVDKVQLLVDYNVTGSETHLPAITEIAGVKAVTCRNGATSDGIRLEVGAGDRSSLNKLRVRLVVGSETIYDETHSSTGTDKVSQRAVQWGMSCSTPTG